MPSDLYHRFFVRPTKATLITILLVVNILAGMLTVISAYGGLVDPYITILPALVSMMLPGLLIADLMLMLLDFVAGRWRMALIVIVSWLVSLPSLLNYSPVNFTGRGLTPSESERSFTLLTYNVLTYWDFRGDVPGQDTNATIDYILSTDADIVSLQEAPDLKPSDTWDITRDQIRQLKERYPYRKFNAANQLTVLSRYPFTYIPLGLPGKAGAKIALFRFTIMGDTVNLYNVHLESIGLNMADKELYQGLFKKAPGSEEALRKELHDVKAQLIHKLGVAFRNRTDQARALRHAMDSIRGTSIVAGDFNDIQGCYAIRTIMDGDMRDAYRDCALGPTITYHGNRFYFRIDHVLYGGHLEARSILRGDSPSSDHYPLLTTFLLPPSDSK